MILSQHAINGESLKCRRLRLKIVENMVRPDQAEGFCSVGWVYMIKKKRRCLFPPYQSSTNSFQYQTPNADQTPPPSLYVHSSSQQSINKSHSNSHSHSHIDVIDFFSSLHTSNFTLFPLETPYLTCVLSDQISCQLPSSSSSSSIPCKCIPYLGNSITMYVYVYVYVFCLPLGWTGAGLGWAGLEFRHFQPSRRQSNLHLLLFIS